MIGIPVIGFALVALLAVGFATFPLWRPERRPGKVRPQRDIEAIEGPRFSVRSRDHEKRAWALLGGAIALFLLGVGGGTYWMTGRPALAVRAAQGLNSGDVSGLIPFLITRVRQQPDDLSAWVYLGRAYMTVDDPGDAAKAYARAVTLARLKGAENAGLDAAYGEALVASQGGAVGDEAQAAFTASLALNPKDPASRFFLGQAKAAHGDTAGALALWQGLLAETKAGTPLHETLVDRIARLTAQGAAQAGGSGGAPDPRMMVAKLAADLKAEPHNAAGWRRLIRAYTVLGQPAEAKAALASARQSFAGDKAVLAELAADAQDLKIN